MALISISYFTVVHEIFNSFVRYVNEITCDIIWLIQLFNLSENYLYIWDNLIKWIEICGNIQYIPWDMTLEKWNNHCNDNILFPKLLWAFLQQNNLFATKLMRGIWFRINPNVYFYKAQHCSKFQVISFNYSRHIQDRIFERLQCSPHRFRMLCMSSTI